MSTTTTTPINDYNYTTIVVHKLYLDLDNLKSHW